MLGVQWTRGKPKARGGIIGIEGGVGSHFQRINAGMTYRAGEAFTYLTFDPWLFVGGTLGVGYGTESGAQPVIGIWEGMPVYATKFEH